MFSYYAVSLPEQKSFVALALNKTFQRKFSFEACFSSTFLLWNKNILIFFEKKFFFSFYKVQHVYMTFQLLFVMKEKWESQN